ncbi:hypothetical protein MMC17_010031 [Xylographa soralifera]|nr:hypothetical protein [Xylographa soralifera]
MVLLKRDTSSLADRQALLTVTLSTSKSNISLHTPEDSTRFFQLLIDICIAASSQPIRPITFCTYGTIFDTQYIINTDVTPFIDTLALGTVTPLTNTSDPTKTISLGNLRVNSRHENPEADMRARDWLGWITVPATGSVQVAHPLSLNRMFKHENMLTWGDIVPGEKYKVHMEPRYVGAMWWIWGDLKGDLKEKKFSEWRKGWDGYNFGIEKPILEAGWIVGEDPEQLWFKDVGDGTTITFVD